MLEALKVVLHLAVQEVLVLLNVIQVPEEAVALRMVALVSLVVQAAAEAVVVQAQALMLEELEILPLLLFLKETQVEVVLEALNLKVGAEAEAVQPL